LGLAEKTGRRRPIIGSSPFSPVILQQIGPSVEKKDGEVENAFSPFSPSFLNEP
jgi:hypothetical protein